MTNFQLPISNKFSNSKFQKLGHWSLVIFWSLVIGHWSLNRVAFAQSSRSFTISPPSIKFSLNPGEKAEKIFKITNNTDESLVFYANVLDFIVTDNLGTPELLPADLKIDNKFAASAWTAIIPDQFTIPAKKSAAVALYLQVPGDARPGGKYLSVAFKPTSEGLPEGTGASVNTVAASLVYLTIKGEIEENARVVSFQTPAFSEYGPIKFSTEIKNLGDIHINPKGQIIVKNLFSQKVFTTALDSQVNIFPGTSRIFQNNWEEKWLLGRYRADLTGYYGQQNNLPLSGIVVFWVIPYKLIILVAAAVVLAVVIAKKTSSRKETNFPRPL